MIIDLKILNLFSRIPSNTILSLFLFEVHEKTRTVASGHFSINLKARNMIIKVGKKTSSSGKVPFKAAAIAVVVIVLLLGSALSKEIYREYKIKKEIETLKSEIGSMEKDNYELSQLLDYYKTNEYKEAEARKRLNLKAEGEQVVMIDEKKASVEEVKAAEEAAQQAGVSNPTKWWNYFFASRDNKG